MRLFGCEERVAGRDRQVFIFKNVVIKLPVCSSWLSFIRGLCSNLKEYETVSTYNGHFSDQMMKIKWKGFLGIVLVVERYQEVLDSFEHRKRYYEHLSRVQNYDQSDWNFVWDGDNKFFNYGWNKYGQLVKLDLGIHH